MLDYELKRNGVDRGTINGYEREEFTHMAVGIAIVSGLADAGVGVRAVANALELDFVPLASEQYDLAIAVEFFESEFGKQVFATLRSAAFGAAVEALGGYDCRRAGEILYRQ